MLQQSACDCSTLHCWQQHSDSDTCAAYSLTVKPTASIVFTGWRQCKPHLVIVPRTGPTRVWQTHTKHFAEFFWDMWTERHADDSHSPCSNKQQRLLFLAAEGTIKSTCTRKHITEIHIQTHQTPQMFLIMSYSIRSFSYDFPKIISRSSGNRPSDCRWLTSEDRWLVARAVGRLCWSTWSPRGTAWIKHLLLRPLPL